MMPSMIGSVVELLWLLAQRLCAAAALIALAPLLLAIGVLVRLSSPGPALFVQERVGRSGRVFSILKFRTMRPGSETQTALGTRRESPSVTRLGRLLRESKLDELPQLWNVARGDMVLVGPRPLPVALDQHLVEHLPTFRLRRSVRPGLTGVAQLLIDDNGTGSRLLEDWSARSRVECHYVRHRTAFYDVLTLFLSGLYLSRRLLRVLCRAMHRRSAVRGSATGERAA